MDKKIYLTEKVAPATINSTLVTSIYPLTDKEIIDNSIKTIDDIKKYLLNLLKINKSKDIFLNTVNGVNRYDSLYLNRPVGTDMTIEITPKVDDGSPVLSAMCVILYSVIQNPPGLTIQSPQQLFTNYKGELVFDIILVHVTDFLCEYSIINSPEKPSVIQIKTKYKLYKDSAFLLTTKYGASPESYSLLYYDEKSVPEEKLFSGSGSLLDKLKKSLGLSKATNLTYSYEWKFPKSLDGVSAVVSWYGISEKDSSGNPISYRTFRQI